MCNVRNVGLRHKVKLRIHIDKQLIICRYVSDICNVEIRRKFIKQENISIHKGDSP
jgi:hypothetical protein